MAGVLEILLTDGLFATESFDYIQVVRLSSATPTLPLITWAFVPRTYLQSRVVVRMTSSRSSLPSLIAFLKPFTAQLSARKWMKEHSICCALWPRCLKHIAWLLLVPIVYPLYMSRAIICVAVDAAPVSPSSWPTVLIRPSSARILACSPYDLPDPAGRGAFVYRCRSVRDLLQ